MEREQLALLRHFASEIYEHRYLGQLRSALHTYWLGTVRSDETRALLEAEWAPLVSRPTFEYNRGYSVAIDTIDGRLVVGNFAAALSSPMHPALQGGIAAANGYAAQKPEGSPTIVYLVAEHYDVAYVSEPQERLQAMGVDVRLLKLEDRKGAFAELVVTLRSEPAAPAKAFLCRSGFGASCACAIALLAAPRTAGASGPPSLTDALQQLRRHVPLARPSVQLFGELLDVEAAHQRGADVEVSPSISLATYMGMTAEEYERWLRPSCIQAGESLADGSWSCGACTLINDASAGVCAVCGTVRS